MLVEELSLLMRARRERHARSLQEGLRVTAAAAGLEKGEKDEGKGAETEGEDPRSASSATLSSCGRSRLCHAGMLFTRNGGHTARHSLFLACVMILTPSFPWSALAPAYMLRADAFALTTVTCSIVPWLERNETCPVCRMPLTGRLGGGGGRQLAVSRAGGGRQVATREGSSHAVTIMERLADPNLLVRPLMPEAINNFVDRMPTVERLSVSDQTLIDIPLLGQHRSHFCTGTSGANHLLDRLLSVRNGLTGIHHGVPLAGRGNRDTDRSDQKALC